MKIFYLSMLAFLLLTGCTNQTHLLVKEGSTPFFNGELVQNRREGNHLVLEASNHRYEARGFVVERHTNMATLRKRYYAVNPKHWVRIFSGLDTDHIIYSIETIARSAEGQEVSCRLIWGDGAKPAGICTDQAGTAFPVRFK